jgi:hypothetical protein
MRQVFIGGCGRSGTTMLGAMLGSHSRCVATPESKFVVPAHRAAVRNANDNNQLEATLAQLAQDWSFRVWDIPVPSVDELSLSSPAVRDSFPSLMESLVGTYAEHVGRAGADVWVDHTPENVRRAADLRELFPEARLIHVIRDGRAAASSVKQLDWGPNTAGAAAQWWVDRVSMGFAAENFFGASAITIRYEDLVSEPTTWLRRICEFLELEYEPSIVAGSGFRVPIYTRRQHDLIGRPPDADRTEAWRQELTQREIEIFESIASGFLAVLGYEPVYGKAAKPRTAAERGSQFLRERAYRLLVNPARRRRRIRRTVEFPAKNRSR